ncbi:MAG: hypothetical protein ABI977_27795 [Acidobacteriota bacterium]
MNKQTHDVGTEEAIRENILVEWKGHIAPRTPMEELIAGVYSFNLNLSPLGVYDDLPALGFTPQMAARLNQCLKQIFLVDLPVDRLLLCATIVSLVNLLSELWGGREIVEEIAWTFLQVEQLSDEEVQSQLQRLQTEGYSIV